MKIFYTFAFILGLTTIWMSKWEVHRTELAGKAISSVVFLFVFLIAMACLSRYKNSQRQQKIKGAVLSRPKPTTPVTEEPAKD